ncbi:uncharacterized protein UV8b_03796 [Ustilaginoidea virens]|uniref:Uncharacterized protein n=1 Tax=Ustilaginoidea virens TaxID=1159556 RepID=A0A8E5HQ00_USTVR|nr:uncharacterized protein UV8b_03796 [Ustilaginoidea virens]QUC19555.1 hypothetical protein UV8b_03796 [Ustilaginoidea virens]
MPSASASLANQLGTCDGGPSRRHVKRSLPSQRKGLSPGVTFSPMRNARLDIADAMSTKELDATKSPISGHTRLLNSSFVSAVCELKVAILSPVTTAPVAEPLPQQVSPPRLSDKPFVPGECKGQGKK